MVHRRRRPREGRRLVSAHRARRSCARCDIAIENRLPVVHLLRLRRRLPAAAGRDLPDRMGGPHLPQPVPSQSKLGVPQLAVVFGHCTAGGAYMPALCDYRRHRARHRRDLPRRPAAGEGRDRRGRDRRGARRRRHAHARLRHRGLRGRQRGRGARARARRSSASGHGREKADIDRREPEPPFYDPDELYGIIPDDIKKQFDMREVIARIVDGSRFHEYQPALRRHAGLRLRPHLGHARSASSPTTACCSTTPPTRRAHFMQLCDRDGTPLLFLQNITGFMVGREYERRGITKDGAKMIMVQANVTVPKFTVIVPRLAGRRQLRHGGPRLGSALPVRLAELALVDHGRRAGGRHAHRGPRRQLRRQGNGPRHGRDRPHPRGRHASYFERDVRTRTTSRPTCATTG